MNDEEICDALGWPRRAAEVLAADSRGLLPRIRAVVREAERREREACAKLAESTVCDTHLPTGVRIYGTRAAAAIRARNNRRPAE